MPVLLVMFPSISVHAEECQAESAILMDASTGAILYEKNMDEELFPASTTKMMTCLIAAESLNPDDTITFSGEAVNSVPADGSNIGIEPGESLTVKDALYAIMVGSANEVAAGVAEKVAGSTEAFADLMNARAKELGCTHTHFVNANGLHDDDHYTSAHDLALIANAFFNNELLLTIGNMPSYHFEPTEDQPDDIYITNKHKLITGEVPCVGIIGGKTGYTSQAGETLVTGCERGDMRLICVVMNEEDPNQFTDTKNLLEWGFENFKEADIAANETHFELEEAPFFKGGITLLGDSSPIFSLTEGARVTLPTTADFDDLSLTIDYVPSSEAVNEGENKKIAELSYHYGDNFMGSCDLYLVPVSKAPATTVSTGFGLMEENDIVRIDDTHTIYINIRLVLIILSILAVVLALLFYLFSYIRSFARPSKDKKRYRLSNRKDAHERPFRQYYDRYSDDDYDE